LTFPLQEARRCDPTAIRRNLETTMKLIVEGMTCDHCVRAITRAIKTLDGVAEVHVDVAGGTVTIDGGVDAGLATAAIEEEGYRVVAVAQPRSCCGSCKA
jgi:copper chaperone